MQQQVMSKMKVLLITNEEWNDFVYGNGVLTNWFTDYDAEFAQIYCSPGKPINSVCDRYFQITDAQMVKSVLGGPKAGGEIQKETSPEQLQTNKENAQRKGIYKVMKNVSMWLHTPVMMLLDAIWTWGRYDQQALKAFVEEFNPDVVFCPRLITPKLMRLERQVAQYTSAPFVAFTGDDEASMDGTSWSPLYWLRKWYVHRMFKKHVGIYAHYLMHSKDQAQEYASAYGVPTSTFFKCGVFPDVFQQKTVGSPIRLVYAGRLYCNRWKTLAEIGKALQTINAQGVRMVLDVYTTEQLTEAQQKALSEEHYIYVKGRVTPDELKEVYRKADIALHVESMDKVNRLLTRVSFSTKVIDLMASSCAILAICWERHTGYQYLKEKDAAFCLAHYEEILPTLQHICEHPETITTYARKAYECGRTYHNRKYIQGQLKSLFAKVGGR